MHSRVLIYGEIIPFSSTKAQVRLVMDASMKSRSKNEVSTVGAMTNPDWKNFEDVFRAILAMHMNFFELEKVEPTSKPVPGHARKFKPWAIDVVGYRKGTKRLVLFEVKRRGRNVEPEQAAGFAYRILDTEAEAGYIVTTMGRDLSSGAKEIADYEKIGHIQVEKDSTPDDYTMKIADNMFVGVTDTVKVSEHIEAIVERRDGSTERIDIL